MFNRIRNIMNSGSVLGYFLQAVPITCVIGAVYIIIRVFYLKWNKSQILWLNELMKFLFVCYLVGLFSLVILPANFWLKFFDGVFWGWWNEMGAFFGFGYFNLIPSIVKYLSGELTFGSWVKMMLLGNVVMFLPFGFFLPFIMQKVNLKYMFAIAAVVPLIVETLQLFLGRSFDVDDLFCNFVGIVVGFFIITFLKRIVRKTS